MLHVHISTLQIPSSFDSLKIYRSTDFFFIYSYVWTLNQNYYTYWHPHHKTIIWDTYIDQFMLQLSFKLLFLSNFNCFWTLNPSFILYYYAGDQDDLLMQWVPISDYYQEKLGKPQGQSWEATRSGIPSDRTPQSSVTQQKPAAQGILLQTMQCWFRAREGSQGSSSKHEAQIQLGECLTISLISWAVHHSIYELVFIVLRVWIASHWCCIFIHVDCKYLVNCGWELACFTLCWCIVLLYKI